MQHGRYPSVNRRRWSRLGVLGQPAPTTTQEKSRRTRAGPDHTPLRLHSESSRPVFLSSVRPPLRKTCFRCDPRSLRGRLGFPWTRATAAVQASTAHARVRVEQKAEGSHRLREATHAGYDPTGVQVAVAKRRATRGHVAVPVLVRDSGEVRSPDSAPPPQRPDSCRYASLAAAKQVPARHDQEGKETGRGAAVSHRVRRPVDGRDSQQRGTFLTI